MYDHSLFPSIANFKRFRDDFEHRGIVLGRFVDFENLGGVQLRPFYEKMGWLNLVESNEIGYPRLLKYFFSNLEVEGDVMRSRVKGVNITLDERTLAEILGISTEGLRYFTPNLQPERVRDCDKFFGIRDINSEICDSTLETKLNLKFIPRVLAHISTYNIMPRGGHRADVTFMDRVVVYKMMKGEPINLPFIMIQKMIDVLSNSRLSIPYGMVFTKIFKKFGVDFKNEQVEKCDPENFYHTTCFKKMGYTEINPVKWVLKRSLTTQSSNERDNRGSNGDGSIYEDMMDQLEDLSDRVENILVSLNGKIDSQTHRLDAIELTRRRMQDSIDGMLKLLQDHFSPQI